MNPNTSDFGEVVIEENSSDGELEVISPTTNTKQVNNNYRPYNPVGYEYRRCIVLI